MDASELFDLYGSDDAVAKARADAMSRRAQAMSGAGLVLRTLTGDRDPTGGALVAGGQHEQDQIAAGIQHGASERRQERHLGVQEQQLANTLRHQQTMEEVAAGRLAQGDRRLDAFTRALELRGVKYNPNTGEFENVSRLVKPTKGGGKVGPLIAPGAAPALTSDAPAPQDATAPAPAPRPALVAPAPGGARFAPMSGKMLDKALKELGADFDPSGGRAGEFGKNQARINAATRMLALAEDPQGRPVDLNPQQMAEFSQSLASLLSNGGTGAQAQIEHLLPKSINRDAAGIMQYLTSEPHGAGQLGFVKNMIETAKRERDVAQQGVESVRGQRAAKHQRVLLGNPEEARRTLKGFGWDLGPDGLPVMGGAKPQAAPDAAAPKQIKDAAEYAALPAGALYLAPGETTPRRKK